MAIKKFHSFAEFYPFYLSEHANVICRRLHFSGTSIALLLFVGAFYWGDYRLALLGFVQGYAWAWVGHFVFEKNRPATFKYPLYSFLGDWVMYKDMWLGKIAF